MLTAIFAAASLAAPAAPAPHIAFCPTDGAWTYSLSDDRGLRSLVLQSAALINPGPAPFEARSAEIQLLDKGEVKDSRSLSQADLTALAAKAPKLEGLREALPGDFCDERMLGSAKLSATAAVPAGQALLFYQQTFAWGGSRDVARLVVHGVQAGRPVEVRADLPIRPGASKTAFHFPLKGTWTIGAAPSLQSHHRWAIFEEFAYDIMRADAKGATHTGDGTKFADYYAYGQPILAAADGVVVSIVNDEPEDLAAMQRPGETMDDYMKRLMKDQATRLAKGRRGVVGDHVVIDHGDGEFSMYAHMQPGSVRVKPGQAVKAGEKIGALGSSGNSTEPHLHFQVCDGPDPLACAGVPARFVDIDQGTLQTGDLITVK